jgi:hypothetical protein
MVTVVNPSKRWLAAAIVSALAAGCAGHGAKESAGNAVPPSPELDGLVARHVKGLDEVYVRPGVSFKSYRAVQLDPLKVEFAKNWDPNVGRRDVNDMVTDEDLQKMKDDMAREFRTVFVEEATAAGLQVVDQPAANALHVSPAVVNVVVNGPDPMHRPARTRTYTRESGHMTLQLDARDASTGQVVAHVVDENRGRDTGQFEVTNTVTNLSDFRTAVRTWVQQMRTGLKVAEVSRG